MVVIGRRGFFVLTIGNGGTGQPRATVWERAQALLVDFRDVPLSALEAAVPCALIDRRAAGPAFDHVLLMFKALILQAMHALSDERTRSF